MNYIGNILLFFLDNLLIQWPISLNRLNSYWYLYIKTFIVDIFFQEVKKLPESRVVRMLHSNQTQPLRWVFRYFFTSWFVFRGFKLSKKKIIINGGELMSGVGCCTLFLRFSRHLLTVWRTEYLSRVFLSCVTMSRDVFISVFHTEECSAAQQIKKKKRNHCSTPMW